MKMLGELVGRISHHGDVGLWSQVGVEGARRKADPGEGGLCDVRW